MISIILSKKNAAHHIRKTIILVQNFRVINGAWKNQNSSHAYQKQHSISSLYLLSSDFNTELQNAKRTEQVQNHYIAAITVEQEVH